MQGLIGHLLTVFCREGEELLRTALVATPPGSHLRIVEWRFEICYHLLPFTEVGEVGTAAPAGIGAFANPAVQHTFVYPVVVFFEEEVPMFAVTHCEAVFNVPFFVCHTAIVVGKEGSVQLVARLGLQAE